LKLFLIREASEIKGDISQGLGIVGTIAKEAAVVKILDNNSHHKQYSNAEILRKIREFQPDIVGFHVHTHNIFNTGTLIANISETFPNICLIAGGLHTYSEPYEVADLGVHIVAVEEADETILPMLTALRMFVGNDSPFTISDALASELRKIPGILFNNGSRTEWENTGKALYIKDLDRIPFVDHDLFNLKDYIKGGNDHHYVTNTLLTQRGCPFSCSFCQGQPDGIYRKVRHNSVAYKLEYIRHLVEKYGHDHVLFYDANFTLDRKITLEFCRAMVESGLNKKVTFWCETNVVLPIDDELAQALKRAGCSEIALGVERLTPDALQRIRKNRDMEVIKNNILTLSRAGINVTANALVGFPFDTKRTIKEEERVYTEIMDNVHSVMVSVLLPLPGTEVYAQTRYKKWYLDKTHMSWKPPFYHFAYNYNGDAWHANYFNLDADTMAAIRGMRERMYYKNMKKLNNRFVDFLFAILKMLGSLSFYLFRKSPVIERMLFGSVKYVYFSMWKIMVNRFYLRHQVSET